MGFQVTEQQLKQLTSGSLNRPSDDDLSQLAVAINATASRFRIDEQQRRVRYFVAQSYYETQGFTFWSERLVYTTPERLVTVWPTRFTMDRAKVGTHAVNKNGQPYAQALSYAPDYVNNAQKLSNLVYANRFGNGDEASGDGWEYRGRGGFHLTFRGNYAAYDQDVYGDGHIVSNPDLVAQPTDAMLSAGWFWNKNNLNAQADKDAFTYTTQIINGSTDTVPQRLQVLNRVNNIFKW